MTNIPRKEFSYHPVRSYDKLYDYIIDSFNRADLDDSSELVYNQKLSKHFEKAIKPVIASAELPYESKIDRLQYADELFDFLTSYITFGENIFHIREKLVDMLSLTDVSEVRISDINLPFESFYIHYGQRGINLFDNFQFIGSYISKFDIFGDESKVLGFLHVASKVPFLYPPDSTEKVVFEKEIYFFETLEYLPLEINTVKENYNSSWKDKSVNELPTAVREKWQPYIFDIYNLVINTLLYLSYVPDDIRYKFSDNTPKKIVDKIHRAKDNGIDNVVERTESKASSMGYKKVRFVGEKVASNFRESKDGNSPSAHWRRGHWRRQPVGKNKSDKNLIWIKPTLVGTNKSSDVNIKHIYDVEDRNA